MENETKTSEVNRKFIKEHDYIELNSLDGAHRYADELAAGKHDKRLRKGMNNAIAIAMPEDRRRYLSYAIGQMESFGSKYEREVYYLKLRMAGMTDEQIAQSLKRPIHEIKEVGRIAVLKMKDSILRIRRTRIPLFEKGIYE